MINPELLKVSKAHENGLAAVLAGQFEEGYDNYIEAGIGYRADDNILREGHLYRDMARALAGMGDAAGRDDAMGTAISKHDRALTDSRYAQPVANSERGVTGLVMGRVAGARMLDRSTPLLLKPFQPTLVGASVGKAMELLHDQNDPDAYGHDYFQQLVSHGPLLIASFSERDQLALGASIANTARGVDMKASRKIAAGLGSTLVHARIHHLPVQRVARVTAARLAVGPYRTTNR